MALQDETIEDASAAFIVPFQGHLSPELLTITVDGFLYPIIAASLRILEFSCRKKWYLRRIILYY